MRLRRQLILVSLLTLSLPWAGCQYIQEMESALRQGQVIALSASARAVADRIQSDPQLLGALQQESLTANPDSQIYAHPLSAPVIIDGYNDDWRYLGLQMRQLQAQQTGLRFTLGRWADRLMLFVEVDDADIDYHNPAKDTLASGDYLILRSRIPYQGKTISRDYIIRAGSPGNVVGVYRQSGRGQRGDIVEESSVRGYWQERQGGYQVELEIPLDALQGYLALAVVNTQTTIAEQPRTWLGTVAENQLAPALVMADRQLTQAINIFAHDDLRLRIVSHNQWLIAEAGALQDDKTLIFEPETTEQHGLLGWVYRLALGTEHLPGLDNPQYSGRFLADEVHQAVDGKPTSQWYQWGRLRVGRAVVPVQNKAGETLAMVVAEQSSEALLALTNSAFNRLFYYSLLATLVAGVGLLSYASWLSFRIRRLNRAADNAIAENGQIVADFPVSRAADEVGDLTRSYALLLGRLREYTEYLRTLSSKLSHELRTPLAIIKTSMDNLEHESLSDSARIYTQRAQEGGTRLSAILNAMSSANRIEEIIQQAEIESVDVVGLLRELQQAYQSIYPDVIITLDIDASVTQPTIQAAPELLVQMLDKIVDNAADFCPAQGAIIFTVLQLQQQLILRISNDGPLLPATMQHQLFDSLVSIRPQEKSADNKTDKAHLGLGLHIVRLIAEFHKAKVSARNRFDNTGVIFELVFPLHQK